MESHAQHQAYHVTPDEAQRFFGKHVNTKTGCWEWTAGKNNKGSARSVSVAVDTSVARASNWLSSVRYRRQRIDHLCRNRGCVNPYHMEAVTLRENVQRGISGKFNREKTHCRNGHEYTPENTRHYTQYARGVAYPGRACRVCLRSAWKRYRDRKRRARMAES